MPILIITFTILFWIFIIFLAKKYNVEKESLLFFISSPIFIYFILIFKDILDIIKRKKLIYDFYKKNNHPSYFHYFCEELHFLKYFIIKKNKNHYKNKNYIDSNSIFLNRYFFSLELSIQKEDYFYNLSPLQFSSEEYNLFKLNLTMNDILIFLRKNLTEDELSDIQKHSVIIYRKPGNEFLDVSEVTTILYKICQLSPKLLKILKIHYENYFNNTNISVKLLLSRNSNFKLDNIFNLIFLLDDKIFDNNQICELSKEQALLNISNQNLCFLGSYNNYSKELQYQYLPLNFLELITSKFKNNLFIEKLSSLIEKNKTLYIQPTFTLELQKFIDFINSLKLVNELNEKLDSKQSKSKIMKI